MVRESLEAVDQNDIPAPSLIVRGVGVFGVNECCTEWTVSEVRSWSARVWRWATLTIYSGLPPLDAF